MLSLPDAPLRGFLMAALARLPPRWRRLPSCSPAAHTSTAAAAAAERGELREETEAALEALEKVGCMPFGFTVPRSR